MQKPEPQTIEEPPQKPKFSQQQQIVDDDFIEKAFENDVDNSSPLKSPTKSPLKSPTKSPEKIKTIILEKPNNSSPLKNASNKNESTEFSNPFLNNYVEKSNITQLTQDTSHHHGAKSLSQSPLKFSKEEVFLVNDNDNAKSEDCSDEKIYEEYNSEDHEVYEPDEEEGEDLVDRAEESKELFDGQDNYIQAGDENNGLEDILEASNENSLGLVENNEFGEDEIKEEEKNENVGKNGNTCSDLKEKYDEAVKREKELRNIIDVKVKDCEKALGKKIYEEIIVFFREKLNVIYIKYMYDKINFYFSQIKT